MTKIFSKIVTGIIVLLVLLGLLSPLAKGEELFVGIEGLLPSKNDDPVAYPVLQEPRWYPGSSWSESLDEPGFVEGRAVGYYQRFYEHSDMSVEFYVYLFSNVSSAEAYCNREINQTKSKGGYNEVSIPDAFAVVYNYGTQEIGVSWDVIKNIVFKVEVYTANIVEDPTTQLVNFIVLEQTRILQMGGVGDPSSSTNPESSATTNPDPSRSIIPEFSSFIILPLLMLATSIAIQITRKNYPKCV